MSICQELEEIYPAYVLDAVDDTDRQHIQLHLAQCAHCMQIVADYRLVADALPLAVPLIEPPANLKRRVLAATTSNRQPQASPSPIAVLATALATLLRSPAFSAITFVLVLILAMWNESLHNQLIQQATANRQILAELQAQREMMIVMAYADGTPKRLQGTEVASRATGRLYGTMEDITLALMVDDLPTLEANKVYQLWLIHPDGTRTSGGTFSVDEQGHGWLMIHAPQPLKMYQSVGITVEPRGGSPKPTGPKMMGMNL